MSSQRISSGRVLKSAPDRRVPPIGDRRALAAQDPAPARLQAERLLPPQGEKLREEKAGDRQSLVHSKGVEIVRSRAIAASEPRIVPPLVGAPRKSAPAPVSQLPAATPSVWPTWDQLLTEGHQRAREASTQLQELFHRHPERCVGVGIVCCLMLLFWPVADDRADPQAAGSARGFRQQLMLTRFNGSSEPKKIESNKASRDEVLDLDAINALLQRFERRSQVVTVSSDQPRKRTIRTIRVAADSTSVEPSVTLTRYQSPDMAALRLRYADREALTSQVLRIISRHGKRGVDRRSLASAIVAESLRQNYDPLFVAAVIKSESAFNTYARSYVGAQGLMQIMPATARYVEDIHAMPRGALSDPGHNLRLGVKYLKYLEAMYKGNRVLTLMAYNWGPGHVERTIKAGRRRGVPREVVNYALRILSDHSRWVQEVNQPASSSRTTRLS